MGFFQGVMDLIKKPQAPRNDAPQPPSPQQQQQPQNAAPEAKPQSHGFWGSIGNTLMSVARANPLTAPIAHALTPAPQKDDRGTPEQGGGNPFAGAKKATPEAADKTGSQQSTAGASDPNNEKKPDEKKPVEQPKKELDPKKVKADADALGKAMDGFIFNDKKAVANTLRGKSAEEIAAIKDEYRKHYGRELDADINKTLGTSDSDPLVKEVKTSLQGDPSKSYIESLKRASTDGWLGGANKDQIQSVLSSMDPETAKKVRAEYKGPKGESLDQMLQSNLKGSDLNMAKGYLDGNSGAVDAAKIDEKMHGGLFGSGGFLGTGWGRDNKGVEQVLDQSKDKEALRKAYESQTKLNLDKDVTKDLSGTQKNITEAVLHDDKAGADAGRVRQATEGWFTDKGAIYKAMEGKKPEEIQKMKEAYNQTYGKPGGGVSTGEMGTVGALTLVGSPLAPIAAFDALRKHRSDGMDFDTMLDSNLGGMDLEKAKRLEKDGKVSDAFSLRYAMHSGFFTDKAEVKRILGGKDGEGLSPEQMKALQSDYKSEQENAELRNLAGVKDGAVLSPEELAKLRAQHGDQLKDSPVKGMEDDVRSHTGSFRDRWMTQSENKAENSNEALLGRDGLEIRQLLRGRADTLDEKVARQNESYQFERSGGVSNTVMDAFTGRGKTYDRQNALMNEYMEKVKSGKATEAEKKELADIVDRSSMDKKGYQETKDSVSNAAAATAAITVSVAATVASGGGASPMLIAALSGLGGMGTKMMLQGNAYSYDDAASDLGNTAISVGTAGLMKIPGVDKAFSSMAGIQNPATATLRQQILREVLTNGAQSGMTTFGQQMINPATYSGNPNEAFGNVLKATMGSTLGGATTGGLNKFLGAKGPQNYLGDAISGIGSTAAGTEVNNLINPANMSGSDGDQAASWMTSLLGGAANNMAGRKAEQIKKSREEQQAHTEEPHPENNQKPTPEPEAETAKTTKPEQEEAKQTTPIKPEEEVKPTTSVKPEHEEPKQTTPVKTEEANKTTPAVTPEHEDHKPAPKKQKYTLTPDEQALHDLRKEAKTPQDHAAIKELAADLKAKRKQDISALRELSEEIQDRKQNGQGKEKIFSVEESRTLQEQAQQLGVNPKKLPKPSTVEESLIAKGMTKEEMELYRKSLNRDQQSTMSADEKAELTRPDRPIQDGAKLDAQGNQRQAPTPEMLKALLKANILLFDDVEPGKLLTKVIGSPEQTMKYDSVRGDVGLNRNTEGMTPEQKVKFLGLDYKGSQHVSEGSGGPQVSGASKQKLYQIETMITEDMAKNAKVPMGVDLYKTAEQERSAQLARLQTEHPTLTPAELEGKLPKLLQMKQNPDTGEMEFQHIQQRARFEQDDPSAGFGYTASQKLRDESGQQYFQPNQELTFESGQKLGSGTRILELDETGSSTEHATLTDGKWQTH